jgi:hypothetical protein
LFVAATETRLPRRKKPEEKSAASAKFCFFVLARLGHFVRRPTGLPTKIILFFQAH